MVYIIVIREASTDVRLISLFEWNDAVENYVVVKTVNLPSFFIKRQSTHMDYILYVIIVMKTIINNDKKRIEYKPCKNKHNQTMIVGILGYHIFDTINSNISY